MPCFVHVYTGRWKSNNMHVYILALCRTLSPETPRIMYMYTSHTYCSPPSLSPSPFFTAKSVLIIVMGGYICTCYSTADKHTILSGYALSTTHVYHACWYVRLCAFSQLVSTKFTLPLASSWDTLHIGCIVHSLLCHSTLNLMGVIHCTLSVSHTVMAMSLGA